MERDLREIMKQAQSQDIAEGIDTLAQTVGRMTGAFLGYGLTAEQADRYVLEWLRLVLIHQLWPDVPPRL